MGNETDTALIVVRDLLMRSRLEEAARRAGVPTTATADLPADLDPVPSLILADLELPGIVARLRDLKRGVPGVSIIGFVSHVDGEIRRVAGDAGIEVRTRGSSMHVDDLFEGQSSTR